MANGITHLIIGAALAAALVASTALTRHKPNDDVAFLERIASTVEQAKVLAPDSRKYVSEVMGRYESGLSDAELELRRQKALLRIMAVMRPAAASDGLRAGR